MNFFSKSFRNQPAITLFSDLLFCMSSFVLVGWIDLLQIFYLKHKCDCVVPVPEIFQLLFRVFIQKVNGFHGMNKLWSGPYLLVWFQLPPHSIYPLYSRQRIIVISEIPKGHPLIFDKCYFPFSILSLCQSLFILQMPHLFLHFYSQKHLVHSSIIAFSLLIKIICLAVYLPNKAVGCHIRLLNLTAR